MATEQLETSFFGVTEKRRKGFALIADMATEPAQRESRISTDLKRLALTRSTELQQITSKGSNICRDNSVLVKYRRAVSKTSHYATITHIFAESISRRYKRAQELESAENFEQARIELRTAQHTRKLMQSTQAKYEQAAQTELCSAEQLLEVPQTAAQQHRALLTALLNSAKDRAAERSKQATAHSRALLEVRSVKDIHLDSVMASSAGDIAPPNKVLKQLDNSATLKTQLTAGGLST